MACFVNIKIKIYKEDLCIAYTVPLLCHLQPMIYGLLQLFFTEITRNKTSSFSPSRSQKFVDKIVNLSAAGCGFKKLERESRICAI